MNRILVSGLLAAVLALSSWAPASAEVVLRFNRWIPPTHHIQTRMLEPWAEQIAKLTEGRVRIEFTTSSLGAPPRQYDLAATGVADVTFGNHDYTPARFALTNVAQLPFLSESAEALSVAYWRTHEKFLAQANEHEGVQLLSLFTHGPGQVFTRPRAIRSIGDFDGMKLRVVGPITDQISKTFGAVPVSAPATEAYELLSRGVVDGTYFHNDGLVSFKLAELVKHQTRVPGGLYNASFFLVMNKAKWDQISEADQKAIMSVSGEAFARMAGKVWDDQDRKADAAMREAGIEVIEASDQLVAAAREKLAHLETNWVASAKDKGVDGQAALGYLREQISGYKSQ